MIQRIVRKALWGLFFFAFFEKFFVPILTSGGYVGLSIATLLSQHHHVTAVDIIPEKVEMINNRKSPIQDDYIEKYLAEKDLDLTATLDAKAAYSNADFVVIAAPTNYDSHKSLGYQYSTMELRAENGKKYRGGIESQPWLRMFFSGMIIRPSCTDCRFRSRYRNSDFTIWDCFPSYKYDKSFDERKGTTRVLIHSEKGKKLFANIKPATT